MTHGPKGSPSGSEKPAPDGSSLIAGTQEVPANVDRSAIRRPSRARRVGVILPAGGVAANVALRRPATAS